MANLLCAAMDDLRQPREGQVYVGPEGLPMLYVRTEQRPGSESPAHLFVITRKRAVFERWLDDGEPVPEAWELVLDTQAKQRADALEAELAELRADRAGLVEALKRAVAVVPVPVANDLRRTWRERRGELLTRHSS